MTTFELILEGPPVSLNAKEGSPRSRRRYREWVQKVRLAARAQWPPGRPPTDNTAITVTVSCYHTAEPPDVDNVLKPICDGLKSVVYYDDKQVWRVISQRFDLSLPVSDPSEALRKVSGVLSEIVYIFITWDSEV